jgi:hypothetical protein
MRLSLRLPSRDCFPSLRSGQAASLAMTMGEAVIARSDLYDKAIPGELRTSLARGLDGTPLINFSPFNLKENF